MKRNLVILLLSLLAYTGCREKPLDMTLKQKTLFQGENFTEIAADYGWDVTIVQDDNESFVELEYSAYLEEYLNIWNESNLLNISLLKRFHIPSNTVMSATVHTSSLKKLQFSDAASVVLEGEFPETDLTVELSDAATFKGGRFTGKADVELSDAAKMVEFDFEGETCSVKVSDASTFKGTLSVTDRLDIVVEDASHLTTYSGHAPHAEVKVSDASSLNLLETEVGTMHITMKDASQASVYVTTTLEGSAKDASKLYYKGNPTINFSCDDSSSINPL